MTQRTIAIIGAMPEEVALIANSLQDVNYEEGASLRVACGNLTSKQGESLRVVATVGGMGTVNAAATTQYLIDTYHPQAVLFSGIAGNLTKSLHVNDIVLGETLCYLDTDMRMIAQWKPQTEVFHSDPALLETASRVLDDMGVTHISGTIATGNTFVGTPEAVAKVRAVVDADAVEMEGASVAHVAARNDVPALVVRAMSDNADTAYEEFREFDISQYADTAAHLTIAIVQNL